MGVNRIAISLLAPPLIIGFLATYNLLKVSSNIAQNSIIWPLSSGLLDVMSSHYLPKFI